MISRETVKSHVRSAMLKLGTRTRTHAVVRALSLGEIPPVTNGNGERDSLRTCNEGRQVSLRSPSDDGKASANRPGQLTEKDQVGRAS